MPSLLYRNDPTIIAWDLANKPYVLEDAYGHPQGLHGTL